jgi:hypothetical protein
MHITVATWIYQKRQSLIGSCFLTLESEKLGRSIAPSSTSSWSYLGKHVYVIDIFNSLAFLNANVNSGYVDWKI